MKRLFALLLALMLCLCACGENPQQNVGNLPEGFDESLFDEVEYDENGNLLRTLDTTEDGTEEIFYRADGSREKEIIKSGDGRIQERTYGDEGYVIRVVTVLDDVTIESISRDANSLEKEIRTYADGRIRTDYFDETNHMTHTEDTFADGTRVETSYYPSCGRHIETTYRTDGCVDVTHFDEDGNVLSSTLTEPNGTKTKWSYEYHDSGDVKVETIEHNDGIIVELHFRTDGTQEKRVVIENGVRTEYPCDEQGNELPSEEDNSENSATNPQGTLTGSVTQEGEYTVVVLGKDNWQNYLEEYTDILFLTAQDRIICRKYFVVKSSVGELDKSRSHVELEYIAQDHVYQCSVDATNEKLNVGQLIEKGQIIHSPSELDQFRIFADVYCDGKLVGYGLSCSACELNLQSTVYCDTVIFDMAWIVGTLYLK